MLGLHFLYYSDSTGRWEYHMAFDINERDATGQNILYVACLLGNKKLMDVIIRFRVKAARIKEAVCEIMSKICGCAN